MAFPTYIGKGTFQSTTLALGTTPSLPASLSNGDLLIAVVSTPNDDTLYSVDGDWTLLGTTGTGTVATAGAVDVWVWFATYNGSALGAFGTTNARLKCQQVYAFRNATDPTNYSTGLQTTAGTAWTLPTLTTTVADSYIFFAIGNDRDADSTANISGYTNSNLTNITEIHDQTVSTGVGGGIATVYAEEATPSTIGTTSCTSASSNTGAFITFSINRPQALTLTLNSGSYTYTGTSTGLLYKRNITANSGSYSYTGTSTGLLYKRVINANSGSYAYTGTNTGLLFGRDIIPDSGSYTYTGTSADLLLNRSLSLSAGSYAYTGTDAVILYARILNADAGSYTYTGTDVTLTVGTQTAYTLTLDSGSYTYTGTSAGLVQGRVLVAGSGSYTYTGSTVDLVYVANISSVYLGTTNIQTAYIGSTPITKIYVGSTKVFG